MKNKTALTKKIRAPVPLTCDVQLFPIITRITYGVVCVCLVMESISDIDRCDGRRKYTEIKIEEKQARSGLPREDVVSR